LGLPEYARKELTGHAGFFRGKAKVNVIRDTIISDALTGRQALLRIPDLYRQSKPTISFEFFTPKTAEGDEVLFRETLPAIKRLRPAYISVTYGAGGSTRDKTLSIVRRARHDLQMEAMAHVTCVGSTREELGAVLDEAGQLGIENILALRGDPPKGQTAFAPVPGGFSYAVDLIKFVKERGNFSVGAACYPEGHVECPDKKLDWDRTAAKVEAGAEFLLSQLFYDMADFLAFEDYLRSRHGVQVPIIPGILPFLGADQIRRFTSLCGSKLPPSLVQGLERFGHDEESVRQFGVEVCTNLCRDLLARGVPGIHFYCLNRLPSCSEVLHNLGLAKNGEAVET
jgi:methylenetetrahydrofolate reductase (NADH)